MPVEPLKITTPFDGKSVTVDASLFATMAHGIDILMDQDPSNQMLQWLRKQCDHVLEHVE